VTTGTTDNVRNPAAFLQEAGPVSPALPDFFVEKRSLLSLIAYDSLVSQDPQVAHPF
jgi:hypothetical protein